MPGFELPLPHPRVMATLSASLALARSSKGFSPDREFTSRPT